MFYGINPQLAAVLAAQGLPVPGGSSPPQAPFLPGAPIAPGAPDPLAPLPDQPAPDSLNDGINSVGRPSDDLAAKQAAHDKALRKLKRQGTGEALMALGAQLLSAKTFGEGLGKGIQAYANAVHANRDSLKPKHEAIMDGAFDRVTDPVDDSTVYNRTPAADYKDKQLQMAFDTKRDVAETTAGGKIDVANIHEEHADKRNTFTWGKREDIAKFQGGIQTRIADSKNTTAVTVAKIRAAGGGKANSGIEKQITELDTDVTNIGNTLNRAAPVLDAINSGRLKFGVVENAKHKAQLAGIYPRDESTDDYSNYQTFTESLRGAYLMAFKGVQTEGDAQRAMDSIIAGSGDTQALKGNIQTVINAIQRQLDMKQRRMNEISSRYNHQGSAPAEPNKTSSGVSWSIVH
jgi:hypothetical protein